MQIIAANKLYYGFGGFHQNGIKEALSDKQT